MPSLARSLVLLGLLATPTPGQHTAPTPRADAGPLADTWAAVEPILRARCHACHAGEQRKGGLSLGTRAGALRGGASGPVVVPRDAAASRLIALVSSDDALERMPPKGERLNDDEVAALRAWIDADLPWGAFEGAVAEYRAPLALMDAAPLSDAPHLIDAHLADYLAARGLAPGAAVSDAEFARRAHFDLIGLPPAPEALARFVEDTDPDKRAALVDALLADDLGYAEHWISFWNDLLRNDFQGTGYIDGGRAQITAWLFEALLTNLPYDEFTRRLIAPSEPASEGFIKGIVWRGDNAVVQEAPMQAAVNVSQVFLGVNLKCAACHDSFVNDWSLAQTFALANCFSDAPLSLARCETVLGVEASYGFLWPELGEVDGAAQRAERSAAVARLVTSRANGYFARTIVNRVWALLMGRGLVEPLDDLEREPWHPALLDALAVDFCEHGYDLRRLLRTIATSEAYQWRAAPTVAAAAADFTFEGPSVRRLSSEQFCDALSSLTGVWQASPQFELSAELQALDPARVRAWRVPIDPLTRALGRTAREQVTTRRESAGTTMQALELANGATLFDRLQRGAAALEANWLDAPRTLVVELWLGALQRAPTDDELTLALKGITGVDGVTLTRAGLEDVLWSLVMLPEFQLLR